uniref:Uncharacterized protein n=1 Tax=Meloidogyne enterolobii TaxID=390850 RepID=A0A6V7XD90_MELEN|nr:unnamed protein product [Meloidogyne enterolobii]
MKRRVLNLLNEQQQVIKVQQSPNVGADLLGSPTSLLCPPCTLPTFKCVEPQPLVLPINCPLPQRPIIPPPPPRISCPPPTVCPPPQPCPAPPTCPRPGRLILALLHNIRPIDYYASNQLLYVQ